MEDGMEHPWYLMLEWLGDLTDSTKSHLQGENYKTIQADLMELERVASTKADTSLEDRFDWGVKMLNNIDAKYTNNYKMKATKESFALNAEPTSFKKFAKPSNGGNGGTPRSAELNDFRDNCEGTIREGFCDKKGCSKKPVSESWIKKRGECFTVKKGEVCRFGRACKFRHANDAMEITDAMKRKCTHRRSTVNAATYVNAAEVVNKGKAAAEEGENE